MKRILPWLAACMLSTTACAGIALDKAIVDIEAGRQRVDDVVVSNVGGSPVRVVISPVRIDNPGSQEEQRITSNNPRELGLIVTPKQLEIMPGEKRIVRLSLLKLPSDMDDIYRIRFQPEEIQPESGSQDQSDKLKANLSITIAYEVLMIVRPPKPELEYKTERKAGSLYITNSGKTCFLLFEGKQCVSADRCQSLTPMRVYSGRTVEVPLQGSPVVQYMLEFANQTRLVEFKP